MLISLLLFTSCNGQTNSSKGNIIRQTAIQNETNAVKETGKDVRAIFQDKNNYWFATYGEGVYFYNSGKLLHYTEKEGLCSNFVSAIQQDIAGNLWFTTAKGLCRFDGEKFSNFTDTLKKLTKERLHFKAKDLFFIYDGQVYQYDGKSFTQIIIYPDTYKPSSTDLDRPYGVYCILKDRAGNMWFGTDQRGVCRYDGKTFTYFTAHGLDKGAVRALFQDRNGNMWFGNNGFGLFRYDGKTLSNFTKEHGLENADFINKKPNLNNKANLARVWAINEDKDGNLWVGTIDNGAWKYNGQDLENLTTKDGLANNKVSAIYKDRQDSLWFVTEGEGVSKLKGQTFEKFVLNSR